MRGAAEQILNALSWEHPSHRAEQNGVRNSAATLELDFCSGSIVLAHAIRRTVVAIKI